MPAAYDPLKLTVTQIRAVVDYVDAGGPDRFTKADLAVIVAELETATTRVNAALARRGGKKKAALVTKGLGGTSRRV